MSNKLNKPDLSHRLSKTQPDSLFSVVDDISSTVRKASGIIANLQGNFLGETDCLNDEIIYWTLQTVQDLLNDINAVVECAHQNSKLQSKGDSDE